MAKVKLFCFLFLLQVLTISFANAQPSRFSAGIEGGPSYICRVEHRPLYFDDPGVGFSAGIFFQYNFKKIVSVKIAPSFEKKGGWDVHHMNLDYIIIPLLIRAECGTKVKGFLSSGPFFGYLLDVYESQGSASQPITNPINQRKNFQQFDAGISVGLGIIIPVYEQFSLSVESRNNFGLHQIINPSVSMERHWSEYTFSSNLLFSFAYNFGGVKSEKSRVKTEK
jgi:hypothetical protein